MKPSRAAISRMIGSAIFVPSSPRRRFSKNCLASIDGHAGDVVDASSRAGWTAVDLRGLRRLAVFHCRSCRSSRRCPCHVACSCSTSTARSPARCRVLIQRVQPHGQRFLLQPRAAADFAGLLGHVLMQPVLHPFAFGVLESALEVGDDAFELRAGAVVALRVGAVHQDVADLLRDVLVRRACS